MASVDWTASGRQGWYECYRIDAARGIGGKQVKMSGIVGGNLTWSLDSDTKVSGSLEVTRTGMVHNSYIRVYYCAKVGNRTQRVELCTCFAKTESGHYDPAGDTYSGTIDLVGVLARHTEDKLCRNFVLAKGKSALGYFREVFRWLGGAYKIQGVKDKRISKTKVVEVGETPMTILQYIADYLGAEITCDTHGRTVIRKYVAPSRKKRSYVTPSGQRALALPGIDISSAQDGTVNRAVVKYTYRDKSGKDVTILGAAAASSSSAISRKRTGRWVTEVYDLNGMSPRTAARAKQLATSRLRRASGYTTSYTYQSLYMPYHIGDVIDFRQGKIRCRGIVTGIDMTLDAAGSMTTTIRKVRGL
jgi:hypothetical protein